MWYHNKNNTTITGRIIIIIKGKKNKIKVMKRNKRDLRHVYNAVTETLTEGPDKYMTANNDHTQFVHVTYALVSPVRSSDGRAGYIVKVLVKRRDTGTPGGGGYQASRGRWM